MAIVNGTNGNDILPSNGIGLPGDDTINGFWGDDILIGGDGDDFLDGGFGFDIINGGKGNDTTSYAFFGGPIVANLATGVVAFPGNSSLTDTLISIENLIGTNRNDSITGNSGANTLNGGAGNDTLIGGNGNDIFVGGAGKDTLKSGSGEDRFVLGEFGSANWDMITGFSATEDTIVLANSLDSTLVGAVRPGIKGLAFNGGNTAGNSLGLAWFFMGAGFNGSSATALSGIYVNTTNGDIFYNPDSTTAGSFIIANVGARATRAMTNADFVYGV